jgi:hypothetical protein
MMAGIRLKLSFTGHFVFEFGLEFALLFSSAEQSGVCGQIYLD